jgi:hypothetical protein
LFGLFDAFQKSAGVVAAIANSMVRLQQTAFGAYNLAESWKLACLKALGLEEWLVVDHEEDGGAQASTLPNTPFQVINLLTWETEQDEDLSDSAKTKNKVSMDPWMETAVHIQANIHDMASWIRQKQREYVSLDIADGEASLIQTTVTSFTATTANEIESLHQCVSTLNSGQKQQHCAGIVQILMTDLKATQSNRRAVVAETVTVPFVDIATPHHIAVVVQRFHPRVARPGR